MSSNPDEYFDEEIDNAFWEDYTYEESWGDE